MAAYTYVSNNSPRDRFEQLSLQMDNGSTAIIRKGFSYDLSATEVARAQQFVVMQATDTITATPTVTAQLPIVGTMQDGQVPVWNASLGAFVPGAGGGGGGSAEAYVWNGSTYVLAMVPVRSFFGPTDPSTVVGFTLRDYDNWTPTQAPP